MSECAGEVLRAITTVVAILAPQHQLVIQLILYRIKNTSAVKVESRRDWVHIAMRTERQWLHVTHQVGQNTI